MTTGRILPDFLSGDKRVEHLCTDLLRLIEEGLNPAFRDWDLLQKENRAVMIETSSLVFSFLDHLHEIHEVERASLIGELLHDLDSVDEEVFFRSTVALLEISNHMDDDTVSAILVKKVVVELSSLWRQVLTDKEKQILRDYARSEKPLYFIKNKLSAAQVAQLLEEVTKETCPFQRAVPSYILVAMETVAKTSQLVGWISDASAGWMSSWPVSDSKKSKRSPVHKPTSSKRPQLESAKAPLKRGDSIFQLRPDPSSSQPIPVTQYDSRADHQGEAAKPVLQRRKTIGIEMFPVLSGTVSQSGVRMGPPAKPKKRISFKIHNDSIWSRLFHS